MDRELDRQEYETWDRVLTNVVPHDHIVQLYQDQDFLNRAVCRFAGAGLANGEGVILVSTLSHWNGFHAQLETENVDVHAAQKRGQLTVVDAAELLPRFMRDAMPDPAIFPGVFGNVVAEARARGLPKSACVGRNGECPVGTRRRRCQHEPRGPIRSTH